MEATLELFLDPRTLGREHPVTAMLRATPESLGAARGGASRRDRLDGGPAGLQARRSSRASRRPAAAPSPPSPIPSLAVALDHPGIPADVLAQALRNEPTPLFSVVRGGRVLLDVRHARGRRRSPSRRRSFGETAWSGSLVREEPRG